MITYMSIKEQFENQVRINSDKKAVVCQGKALTYNEFNQMANQLAWTMTDLGIMKNKTVIVVIEPRMELLISIIAIIKAGGTYVPVDPSTPDERILYIVEESKASLILYGNTKPMLQHNIGIPMINVNDGKNYSNNVDNLPNSCNEDDILCILFTSGTEGRPKGVVRDYQSLSIGIEQVKKYFSVDFTKNIAMLSNVSFILSQIEIFPTLISGGTVILLTEEEKKNLVLSSAIMIENCVSALFTTPSYFTALVEDDKIARKLLSVFKTINFAGEPLKIPENVRKLEEAKNIVIHNFYGSTETMLVSINKFMLSDYVENCRNIGIPFEINKVVLINDNKQINDEEPGEIMVSGLMLAKGYLLHKDNREKFIKMDGRIWYKTGDIGKWCEDGTIDFLDRKDNQIKVNGIRIELQEIETVLKKQKDVKQAVVVSHKGNFGDNEIWAYVTGNRLLNVDIIKNELKKIMPYYMLPKGIIQIDNIPVTANGKIDKKSLPILKREKNSYIAPRNDKEKTFVKLFEQIIGEDEIGIQDDFFLLGGDSLKAMRLINSIQKEFGFRFTLKSIFLNPTIEKLVLAMSAPNNIYQIFPAEKKQYYEMSVQQKSMYLIYDSCRKSTVYNIPIALHLNGVIDSDRLKKAFQRIVNQYEIFRTSFRVNGYNLIQSIESEVEAEYSYVEEDRSESVVISNFIKPFVLEIPSQIRLRLVKMPNNYLLLLDMHHIISDGRTAGLLLSRLADAYSGRELEKVDYQYKDYSEWMLNRDWRDNREYWLNKLKGNIEPLNLPYDYVRPSDINYEGNTIIGKINKELRNKIRNLATFTGVTEYIIMLSAFMILLSKYSRQENILVGSPVSARTTAEIEQMMGMFVNTVVLRAEIDREKNILDFISEMKETVVQSFDHQEYPFERIIDDLKIDRTGGRNPLINVMFAVQNNETPKVKFDHCRWKRIETYTRNSKFDLTFNIEKISTGLLIEAEYNTNLFQEGTVKNMLNHFIILMQEMTEKPLTKIGAIKMYSNDEKRLIGQVLNKTRIKYPDTCLIKLFEKQVRKTPNAIAIIGDGYDISYSDFNKKVNQLAIKLRKEGIGPNDFVPVITKRNLYMMISIYGVIKAGAAYVPISPELPKQRITYILNDIMPKVVLVSKEYDSGFDGVSILHPEDDRLYYGDERNLKILNKSTDPIYVIYTSGTSGDPKGVINVHEGLLNRILWMQKEYPIIVKDTILQKTTYTFDVSVWEIFWWGLFGGKVSLLNNGGEKSPTDICSYIKENKVSVLHFVPSMLDAFLYYLENNPSELDKLNSLKQVFTSGEALNINSVRVFYKLFSYKNVKLSNLYGPTEASIDVTFYNCTPEDNIIPIGKPISNIKIYIYDGNNLCGIGVPGELCISGVGLSKGYLNKEKLTNEKFLYNSDIDEMMYRTGDLARWLSNGNIEFLGRIDQQVKIRGFRIELGEIEAAIKKYFGIGKCALVVKESEYGEKSLCAYIVSEQNINYAQLKNVLKEELPDYMIPSYFMQIEHIPVTENGKLDKKALPPIKFLQRVEYEAPQNEIEQKIADIYEEILEVENVGVNDNFFDLGGNSMLAMRAVTRINKEGYSISVGDVLKNPTIKQMMGVIIEQEIF